MDHPSNVELRAFLKDDEKWKDYENLDVEWIHHHNPDLVILNDRDQEVERIDLNGYNNKKLVQLLKQKGFRKS